MPNPAFILTLKEISIGVGHVRALSHRDGAEELRSSVHLLSVSHAHLDTHSRMSDPWC